MIEITNECNMELMSRYPDNHFDLAIVDPPYGLGKRTTSGGKNKSKGGKNYQAAKWEDHKWDNEIPDDKYFIELFRVSKKQIIWGGNYFPFIWKKGCRGLITWDKMVYLPTMSQIEYAWYSEDKLPKLVKIDNNQLDRQHPTQKPVQLYSWILQNYSKEGDKILDTHIGSGSIAIAVDNANKIDKMNLSLTGCELDKDYYTATMKRIKEQTNWQSLF